MIRPNIKEYHKNLRQGWMSPTSEKSNFIGQTALELYQSYTSPPVANIKQKGSVFELELVLPGFKEEEITFNIYGKVLVIHAERKKEQSTADSAYLLQEFDIDIVERQFELAEKFEREQIKTTYENGIYTLSFFAGDDAQKKTQTHSSEKVKRAGEMG